MDKSVLKHLYEEFLQLPFPQGSNHKDLTDWVSELAEMDGFYAGLAVTLIMDKSIKIKEFPSLDSLFARLKKLKQCSTISENHYQEYEHYLWALERLANGVQAYAPRILYMLREQP